MGHIALIIGALTSLLLIFIGYAIKDRKAYWLISGYNMMSEEKKKNVDIEGLAGFMAYTLYIMAGIMLLAWLFLYLKLETAGIICFFLIIPLSIYMVIKSQNYDANTRKKDGSMKKGTKILICTALAVSLLVIAGVGTLLYHGNKPADYIMQEDGIKITGIYGEKLLYKQITNIQLKDKLPEILLKTNGSAIGSSKKGYFKLRDIGEVKLFINTEIPAFIFIEKANKMIVLNAENIERTKILFEELRENWKME